MAAQHLLPASYIGRFSMDQSLRLRKRTVWVQRVGRDPYPASAEYVGHLQRIYDRENPSDWGGATIDDGWKYEGRLPAALTALESQAVPLDARTWAEVLVPFVSSLFIRGLDFASRYESRIPGITGPGGDPTAEQIVESWHDNTIAARQLEWQRLLAPVMSAQWTVVHGSGSPILITNDVAHCLMTKQGGSAGDVSYAIPISPSSVLVLERRTVRRILDWDGDAWYAPVDHRQTTDEDLRGCRRAIQEGAVREVYGPTREAVAFPAQDFQPKMPPLGPGFLLPFPRGRGLLPYIDDYFRVLTLLDSSPADYYAMDEKIDWTVVSRSWGSLVQVILDLPRFPGGLAISSFGVYLDLGRFTVDDVEAAMGRDSAELAPAPTEPRPELLRLLQDDFASRGVDPALLEEGSRSRQIDG